MGISDEEKETDVEEGGETEIVLDLSGRKLVKLEKAPSHRAFATALVLDDNALQSLHNLDSYGELQRISLSNNKIVRMYFFARMYSLRILNLPGNNIVNIEGLKELHHLVHLNLAANSIKSMDGLANCFKLQHLNVSGNQITTVSDLSSLVNLKELFLHRNKMYNLSRCNKYLPSSLVILTLSDNQICDLNHLFTISHLNNLEQFTILNNPCLQPLQLTDLHGLPVGLPLGFDYRPYVINWCLNLKVLDGYKVTPLETLKGEWLYSQGKGRHFQPGEHGPLVEYLSGICLAGGGWGGAALPEHDMKLVKILQLAKQHQQELRNPQAEPLNSSRESSSLHNSPAVQRRNGRPPPHSRRHTAPHKICPIERRTQMKNHLFQAPPSKLPPNKYSVELSSTLYGGELKTPESSISLMTQSMDPSMLSDLNVSSGHTAEHEDGPHSLSMTQSLGPEQLEEALFNGHHQQGKLTWRSQSGNNINYDMTQSLGPEQLALQLSQPYDAKSRINGLNDGEKGNAPFHRSLSAHQASHHAVEARQKEKRTGRSTSRGGGPGRYATCLTSNPQGAGAAFRSSSVGSSGIDRRPPIGSNRSPPRFSPRYGAAHQNGSTPYSSMNGISRYGPRSLEGSKERNTGQFQRQVTYTREGRSMSITEAVITLQKYWRGYIVRKRRPKALHSKEMKSNEKIKFLELKLQKAEESLEREKRMRLSQLEAIKTLWKQVGRLQSGKATPSATPATTPLTPLTPMDGRSRSKQDDTVKELTDFCQQLQSQVISLQDSLTSVSSVMNAFCQLPASKAVLLNEDGTTVEGSKSLSALTSSISALTSSITTKNDQSESSVNSEDRKTVELTTNGRMEEEKTVDSESSPCDSPTLVNNPAKNVLPQRPSSLPVSQRRN